MNLVEVPRGEVMKGWQTCLIVIISKDVVVNIKEQTYGYRVLRLVLLVEAFLAVRWRV